VLNRQLGSWWRLARRPSQLTKCNGPISHEVLDSGPKETSAYAGFRVCPMIQVDEGLNSRATGTEEPVIDRLQHSFLAAARHNTTMNK
jgi:hypothetical protein